MLPARTFPLQAMAIATILLRAGDSSDSGEK